MIMLIILILTLLIIFLLISNEEKKKKRENILYQYNKIINKHQVVCALKCNYLQGISCLTPNSLYFICANYKQVIIVDKDNREFFIPLQKLAEFYITSDVLNLDLTMRLHPFAERVYYCNILFKADTGKGIIRGIFQFEPLDEESLSFNKLALSRCDIFTFVNQQIQK